MSDPIYYAKKPVDTPGTPTVAEHCRSVRETADAILSSMREDIIRAAGAGRSLVEELQSLLGAAALLHDFAKVNSAFQAMLRSKPGSPERQPVRHEILAAWLLTDADFLGPWFSKLFPRERAWPIIWAIAGHHLKMGDPAHDCGLFNTGSGTASVDLPLACNDVRILTQEVGKLLNAAISPPAFVDVEFDTADEEEDGLEDRILGYAAVSRAAWQRLCGDPVVVQLTALLKATLVAADVAGSALAANGQPSAEWVERALSVRVRSEVLEPIIVQGTKGRPPLDFQRAVGNSTKLATIVVAGCGNGKTTAAYLWAQRHAVGRKLWFTYPTTGTASAGYEGYLYDHPDLASTLMHGRAETDLEAIRGTHEDTPTADVLRLESLRAWGLQAVVCTVDTVLGLLQNQRRPMFSFPAIVAGAFVFDEIHSYDARLFGALLRFLAAFPKAPTLLMSASIPPTRLQALREVLGDRADAVIRGDPIMEGHKRYLLNFNGAGDCREEVSAALRQEKKVLWVCNTVRDAVQTAREAQHWAGVSSDRITVYHSRFQYRHRVQRQKEVIARFEYCRNERRELQRLESGPSLVIATQVCEMSLDISADLMVTAECPLSALVQRLGRLNRYAENDDPWPCLVYPFQGDPYNEDPRRICTCGDFRAAMAAAREAVNALADKPCSQRDLAQRLDKMVEDERFETYSAWLDDGWLTEPLQLRDGGDTITLIREEDLGEIERELGPRNAKPSRWTMGQIVPWTIPMHYRHFDHVDRIGGYPVAPRGSITYTKAEGAEWARS